MSTPYDPPATFEPVGPLAWQTDALCAETDPELFVPDKGGSTMEAKRVCASCTVREQCLEYALANNERTGIYGGLSPRQRLPLHRAREAGRVQGKGACVHGHDWSDPRNVGFRREHGGRYCRACDRERRQAARDARRDAA